jgi:hypothetical protein
LQTLILRHEINKRYYVHTALFCHEAWVIFYSDFIAAAFFPHGPLRIESARVETGIFRTVFLKERNMKKLSYALAGIAPLAIATVMALSASPAEARIVCREGWGWHGDRCVEIRHARPYRVGGYIRDYYEAPRARWVRYGHAPRGYRYVMVRGGNDLILINGRGRIIRVY